MQKLNETPEERMARLEKEAYETQEKAKQAMEANRTALTERQVRFQCDAASCNSQPSTAQPPCDVDTS